MNQPRETPLTPPVALDCQIDRLVDGELPDADRRTLLRRLETEPDGFNAAAPLGFPWKPQKLAHEALVPMTAIAPAQPPARVASRRTTPNRWRSAARLTGLAASFALTFGLGWALHGKATVDSGENSVAKIANLEKPMPRQSIEQQGPERNLGATFEMFTAASAGQFAALVPVVKQWEQQGYQAETQTRLASVKLKDGRKVEIPVREVRLRYVGNRVY